MSLRPHITLIVSFLTAPLWALDVDSGMDAIKLARTLNGMESGARSMEISGGWARLRGIDLNKVPETRKSLHELRSGGIRTCVFLRRSIKDWKTAYLPDNLSEAYEQGRKLGSTYGDLVDAWEIDNEPDLGFVPESAERYTAFLKATYLGLQRGFAEGKAQSGKSKAQSAQLLASSSSPLAAKAPLVLMGALGLPPGPWLERFAANDGFAYTDGFNSHYYGYAEDFTGVYHQHEAAVTELSGQNLPNGSANFVHSVKKSLPVFMTEIGYGMLGKEARDTKEGRLRQWRWFKSVGEQATNLRIEAPMAFYLPPYLEYGTSEYGLTVPAKQETEKAEGGKLKAESWIAGGIEYSPSDFGVEKAEHWMANIGKQIGGNENTPALAQWLATRRDTISAVPQLSAFRSHLSERSRSWSVTTAPPSPIVIDFLPDAGLSHIKRYNGSFVTGREPPVLQKAEEPSPKSQAPKPKTPTPRSEDFILQIRTQNGNLYEVYPTRQATPDWQRFMEPGGNFTMAFYGRAALPWRFKDNKPASLVLVLYPKSLPVTYEFRQPQLLKLGARSEEAGARSQEYLSNNRYAAGTVVLYNFSDKPVTGRLELPSALSHLPEKAECVAPREPEAGELIVLQPGERRQFPVGIKVPWGRYEPIKVPITFIPDDANSPTARYLTSLIPDIAGVPGSLIADILLKEVVRVDRNAPSNRKIVLNRARASEEAPMIEQSIISSALRSQVSGLAAFAQSGAIVEQKTDGFTVRVTARSPGKPQRIEVDIPWPDDLAFGNDEFLSMEFRLCN